MNRYSIRGAAQAPSILEIIKEIENGYYVRIVRSFPDWEDTREEFVSRDLFDTCLRTGYFTRLSA
jgi:hypothetical protein